VVIYRFLIPIGTTPITKYQQLLEMRGLKKSYLSNRPWRPAGLRDVKDPTFSRQLTYGDKVVSLPQLL
jgi:hypothetical protein